MTITLPALRNALSSDHVSGADAIDALFNIVTRMAGIDRYTPEPSAEQFELLWDALLDEIGTACKLR